MFSVNETSDTFSCIFSSQKHLVDRCIEDIKGFIRSGLDDCSTNGFELAVRELLLNAVEHGNKNDQDKHVTCTVERRSTELYCITVTDQGEGFELDLLSLNSQFHADKERHRGLAIVDANADSFTINKSDKSVTIYIKIQLLKPIITRGIPEGILIIPQTDLIASCANQFRNKLLECININPRRIRFDFSHIGTIDSTCLSVFTLLIRSTNSQESKTVLEIINAGKELEDLFRLTRLTDNYRFMNEETNE